MLKSILCMAVLAVFLFTLPVSAARKEYSQIIEVNDYTYEIEVDGFRDPVNETIIIENLGEEPLVNPRITVDGKYDWFDTESIARAATLGCKTDEERAFSIFNFVRYQTQQCSNPGDRDDLNPVVYFNVYGYGNCAMHGAVSVALARALGMKARVWEVWYHTVNEFRYNNAWHMHDSSIGLYYLMGDNRTVASIEQLWEDQQISGGTAEGAKLTGWSGRNKAARRIFTDVEGNNPYVWQDGIQQRGYRYYHADEFCYVQGYYDHFTYKPHTMAMTLRPSEKLVRNWKGGPVYYDYKKHDANYERDQRPWRKPIRYGDGQIVWTPDLKSTNVKSFISSLTPGLRAQYNTAFSAEDGIEPAIHVRQERKEGQLSSAMAMFSVRTPYTIIGGNLKAKVYRGTTDRDGISVRFSKHPLGADRERVWEAPEGVTGSMDVDVDLDELLYPEGERGRHIYSVRFQFSEGEGSESPTHTGVESIEMATDIQCAPNSLPALALGKNIIRYRDETPGPHKVKITHIWRERTDNHPPRPPKNAKYPKDGSVVKTLAPLFKWTAARDSDKKDRIDNYCITISFDPQCRWPIATALLKETGAGKPEWKLSDGWLNGDTTYYWRVKSRDSRGVWGDWSPVFRFKTAE
ncbi:MAG: transglutaminase-like domain-containing protein [Gemmatimonadota bacterium]|nr:transglutaminase-like domain-containing protein [Gemmatimonadota bacterium]